MSAIGSYAVLSRSGLDRCLDAARGIRTETTGAWLFKTTKTVGAQEFRETWNASILKEVVYDGSGYVLGNYLDAQEAVNHVRLADEESEAARTLAPAFTAVFVFDAPAVLPELPRQALETYCRDEFGDDRGESIEALAAAHDFFVKGLSEITGDTVVVFLIR